jgi:TRAP-type C4-dicarboxylate transport system permease small subunit
MMLFVQAVRRLSMLGGILAVALLLLALYAVCHLVVVRYVLNASAIWQHEVVSFSLIGATFLGAPYVLMTGGHVNVDLLEHYCGARGRLVTRWLGSLVTIGFCGIIAWVGTFWWWEAWAGDWHNETVWAPPLWIPYAAMPLGMGLMCLQAIADLIAPPGARPGAQTGEDRAEA